MKKREIVALGKIEVFFKMCFCPIARLQRKQCCLKTLECSLKGILLCSYVVRAEKWGMIMFSGSCRLPGSHPDRASSEE
jgi:hypothetical protein